MTELLSHIFPKQFFLRKELLLTLLKFAFSNFSYRNKNIVFLNLVTITLTDDLYNTTEHLFLEHLQEKLGITPERRRELMAIAYDERDLRERAARILKQ